MLHINDTCTDYSSQCNTKVKTQTTKTYTQKGELKPTENKLTKLNDTKSNSLQRHREAQIRPMKSCTYMGYNLYKGSMLYFSI